MDFYQILLKVEIVQILVENHITNRGVLKDITKLLEVMIIVAPGVIRKMEKFFLLQNRFVFISELQSLMKTLVLIDISVAIKHILIQNQSEE